MVELWKNKDAHDDQHWLHNWESFAICVETAIKPEIMQLFKNIIPRISETQFLPS